LLIPSTVLCEVDYFITKYLGDHVAKAFLEGVAKDRDVVIFDALDLARVNAIRRWYDDLPLGFVDASIIALAERHGIQRVLTLDRRHFSAIKPNGLNHFVLLP
jgi:uncharacterized protein